MVDPFSCHTDTQTWGLLCKICWGSSSLFESVEETELFLSFFWIINCISAYHRKLLLSEISRNILKICIHIFKGSEAIWVWSLLESSSLRPGAPDSQTPNSHQSSSPAETSQAWSSQQSSAVMCHDQVSLREENWTSICSLTPQFAPHRSGPSCACLRKSKWKSRVSLLSEDWSRGVVDDWLVYLIYSIMLSNSLW